MYTLGQLKTAIRQTIWPEGEADNLVAAHDKFFVDALLDIQTWVKCQQQDHTDIIPQCATLYNCGLTVFDAPRGAIFKLSVIDGADYCSEITYHQVDACYIRSYLTRSSRRGCCLSIPLFFGFPASGHAAYPVPTDAGLPAGLPLLPLGYHYPQTSTDRPHGRSRHGVWAIERGKIYVAPWIQSAETILLKWDGIKRTWTDADPVDPDPQLASAIEEYVRWQHAGKYDRDSDEAARAAGAYNLARQTLIYNCREETRKRGCETSLARGSSVGTGTLYYNEEQSAGASCPAGQTGAPVSVTIPAGTVGSTISISDANEKAQQQAQVQAQAQLVCSPTPTTYWNAAQTQTASCDVEEGAPTPVGTPVTVTIPANTYSSTVSQSAADALAQSAALAQARAQRSCTYGNAAQTAECPNNPSVTATVPPNTFQSTISQADADALAMAEAQNRVNADPSCLGSAIFWNTVQNIVVPITACIIYGSSTSTPTVGVTVPAHLFSGATQSAANTAARNAGQVLASSIAQSRGQQHLCQSYTTTYPGP